MQLRVSVMMTVSFSFKQKVCLRQMCQKLFTGTGIFRGHSVSANFSPKYWFLTCSCRYVANDRQDGWQGGCRVRGQSLG